MYVLVRINTFKHKMIILNYGTTISSWRSRNVMQFIIDQWILLIIRNINGIKKYMNDYKPN